jgi:hypothetical protein
MTCPKRNPTRAKHAERTRDLICAAIEQHRKAEAAFEKICAKYPNGSSKTQGPEAKAGRAMRQLCTIPATTLHGHMGCAAAIIGSLWRARQNRLITT